MRRGAAKKMLDSIQDDAQVAVTQKRRMQIRAPLFYFFFFWTQETNVCVSLVSKLKPRKQAVISRPNLEAQQNVTKCLLSLVYQNSKSMQSLCMNANLFRFGIFRKLLGLFKRILSAMPQRECL